MTIETKILEIIEEKRKAPLAKPLLYLLSQGYRMGVILRHLAYDSILPLKRSPAYTVSVGNIVAGGSGKTPIVRYLAERLQEKRRVAILSRGYRRQEKKPLVAKEGVGPRELGDEPYWLSKVLPGVEVVVGADRSHTAQLATRMGCTHLLLDDGMQHRRLKRDLEIVVMQAKNLFGKGFYLPRGLLRDSPKRLAHANLILITGVENKDQYERLKATLAPLTSAPITTMQMKVENGEEIRGKKIASFCAIAGPERFQKTLESLGCQIVAKREKPDHHPFSKEELEELSKKAPMLVCTEKDAVKLSENILSSLSIQVLKITYEPQFGKEHLEKIIQEVPHD